MKRLSTLLCLCTFFFFVNAQCPITNGNFDTDLSGWNITGDVVWTPSPNTTAKICGSQSGINQLFPTQPGKTYLAAFNYRTAADHGFTVYQIRALDVNWTPIEISGGNGVLYFTSGAISGTTNGGFRTSNGYEITTPPNAAWFQISIWHEQGGCIEIDNVSICESGTPPNGCTNDSEAPVFDLCPGNRIVNTTSSTSTSSAPIDWTAPLATDNCDTPVVNSNFNPGTIFNLGTTEVIYTAEDVSSNSTTCSFVITVRQAPVDNPDLQIENVVIGNTNVNPGESLAFNFDLVNSGPQPASGDFYMAGYISTDKTISPDDFSFQSTGFVGNGFFPPNFTRNLPGTVQVPSTLANGDYYLIIFADGGGSIPESNEDNNATASQSTFSFGGSSGGNLVLETTDVDIDQWGTGTVEFLLRNLGPESIFDIEVDFNFSDDIRLVGGNEYDSYQNTPLRNSWTNNPTWEAGVIAQGGSKFIRFNVYSITNDPMYIYGQVANATGSDSNSTPGNGTPPTPNEDDEAVANINGNGGGGTPDLQMGSMVIPRPAAQGQTITNNFNFRNVGDASVNQPFAITAYLSTDGNISNNDFVIGNINFTDIPIAAGENNSRTMNMTIPSNAPAGFYYLIVKVDANDVISETNEFDNINSILGSFEVIEASAAKPDLRLFNLTLDELSVKTGDVLNYNFDIGNLGTANAPQNFNVRAYLSTDGDISNDDIQDGIVPTGNFDAGLLVADVPGASTINLPEGDYYLLLRVDADNQVNESDETNNDLQANIQFTVDNNPGGNGSACDKQIAQDMNSFNCIESTTANGTINVIYNTTNGVIEKTLNQNLDVITTGTRLSIERPTFVLDDVTLTKTNADGSVAYTRMVPQAFADRFNYRPQLIEFMGGYVFFGQVDNPAVQKAIRTDNNFNILFEKDTPIANDPLRNAIRSINSVNGNNIAFISGSTVTFGSSATVFLWDANLNELDNLPLFSGAWQGGANLSENACNKWTVTDGVGLGYCKSGGCYRSERREVEFNNNSIQVNSYYGVEHYTTLGVGSEKYDWSAKTSDGGNISANRNQNLNGSSTPVPNDAQITFTKTDANGNVQWERDYLITDWGKVFRIYESAGTIYILKNVDGELLMSDLECYDLPADLPDLVITDVNAPASAVEGSSFNLSYTLRNTGTLASQSSILGLYLSRDQQLGFDSPMRNVFPQYQSINPDGSIDVNIMVTVNTNNIGTNYLLLVADAQAQNAESNEDNNLIAIPIEITEPNIGGGVDLEISTNLGNPSPSQWSVFTTTVVIANNGGETATGIEVEFRPTTDAVYQGGNEGTVSQGTFRSWEDIWEVGTLAPGEIATLDINLFRIGADNFVMYTQVTAQNETDDDSTPNNGVCCNTGEDDEGIIVVSPAGTGVNNRNSIVQNLGNQPFAIVNAMPNPFTDEFKLQVFSNENQESEITVMNTMGQAIFRKEVNLIEGLNTFSIDMNEETSGVLMVKMTPFHPYLRQIRVMRVRD